MSSLRASRRETVPVVDLFAGPGGLSEGFNACERGQVGFDVLLSVEKDPAAHQTLLLRAFFRQLRGDKERRLYYAYLRREVSRDDLFKAIPRAAENAKARSLLLELGPQTTRRVYSALGRLVGGTNRWVLVGGPPCQAYSVVGRSRLSKLDREDFERSEKHTLYREYLRILARYRPAVFVMENVKGILSATYGGESTFHRILSDLASPTAAARESTRGGKSRTHRRHEYKIVSLLQRTAGQLCPEDYVIRAELFGVPQKRHRVILLGVRSDIEVPPGLGLQPCLGPPVADVLRDLPPLRSRLSRQHDDAHVWVNSIRNRLGPLWGGIEVDVFMRMAEASDRLDDSVSIGGRCVAKSRASNLPKTALTTWLLDEGMNFVVNHEARGHIIEDLIRYLFAASYAAARGVSPTLHDFPQGLLPDHHNVKDALKLGNGLFSDRFRVQVADRPATTVTSHISKDGHYFIHHDAQQCRSWTVREAARAQTFPDNYFFEGTRTEQFKQVGNAVPPYLALQIAEVVGDVLASTD